MRTEQFGRLFEPTPEWLEMMEGRDEVNPYSIMASGYKPQTPPARSMLSQICTCISDPESFSLSLSSRAVKVLNVSYWSFTVLSCITFFTSHWSLFLAFLIPALAMLRMRVARKTLETYYALKSGSSTNGT